MLLKSIGVIGCFFSTAVALSCGGDSGLRCKNGDFYLDGKEFSSCSQCDSAECGFRASTTQVCTYPGGVQHCVSSGTVTARCGSQTATISISNDKASCGGTPLTDTAGSGGTTGGATGGRGGPALGTGGGRVAIGTGGMGGGAGGGGVVIGTSGGRSGSAGTGGGTSVDAGTTSDGPSVQACAKAPSAKLTDFSDGVTGTLQWGSPGGINGVVSSYGALGGTLAVEVDQTAQNVHAVGNFVPDPALNLSIAGVVLVLNACVDASAYGGVQFELAGTYGDATVSVAVGTVSTSCSPGATCTVAATAPAQRSGVITARWSELTGAAPNPFDPREINAIHLILTGRMSAPIDVRLDNLTFISK